jgi:HEAT repeat protein
MLRVCGILAFLFFTVAAQVQSRLEELFTILRTEGPRLSESGRARSSQIALAYLEVGTIRGEDWVLIDSALRDMSPFVRDQACALLAALLFTNRGRPVLFPEPTRELLVRQLGDTTANARANTVRILILMEGGLPVSVQPRILQMAGSDPDSEVRRTAIGGLASIARPSPEVLEFWKRSLSDTANKSLRGMVLNSFRLSAPTDPDIVDLVIDALRDADRFVRQEANAAACGDPRFAS